MFGHIILIMTRISTPSASSLKPRCLELLDRVREIRRTQVITQHGRPVARLLTCEIEPEKPFFGSMAGTVIEYEGAFDPIPGEWFSDPFLNPPARPRKRPSHKRR